MREYFGTDGVRGIANAELSPELAFRLGRCGGYVLMQHVEQEHPRVIVGRDTRISGEMLESALIAGLLSVGIQVMQVGVTSTPAIAYLTRTQGVTAGVMISASHNPVEDNGVKFFGPDGFKLSDDLEHQIESLLDVEDELPRPSSSGLGTIDEFPEGTNKYIQYLQSTVSEDLSGMRIIIDAANGGAAPMVNQLFANLDTDFITMGDRPDGLNINDGVGSTQPERLQSLVRENEGYIGIALDGDADRLIAVSENGSIVDGDKILYILAKYLHQRGRLAGDTVVSTVMSNIGFHRALESLGINSIETQVGDRYVVEAMVEGDYVLGGEQSGHIVMMNYNTTGDGLLTAIQLLEVIKSTGKTLTELANEVNIFPQKLVNIRVHDKNTVMDEPEVQEVIQQIEEEMHGDGRILVRPSGTEPLLRVMAEAATSERVNYYVDTIADVIRRVRGVDEDAR